MRPGFEQGADWSTSLQVDALLSEKDAERQATQTELDDLLMVFSDLEEKVARYKVGDLTSGERVSGGISADTMRRGIGETQGAG